jgi:hypothetical protein
MASDFADFADFVTVYISEAHPADGWSIDGGAVGGTCYLQPRTNKQRQMVASALKEDKHFWSPLYIDDVESKAGEIAYCALPERIYVILDNKVVLRGGIGPMFYSFAPVRQYLENYALLARSQPA